jgi:hypothetical protein
VGGGVRGSGLARGGGGRGGPTGRGGGRGYGWTGTRGSSTGYQHGGNEWAPRGRGGKRRREDYEDQEDLQPRGRQHSYQFGAQDIRYRSDGSYRGQMDQVHSSQYSRDRYNR